MTTPKQKGRKSDPEAKKKTPKKMPEDALKKRLNILYKTAYEYTVSRCGLRRGGESYHLVFVNRPLVESKWTWMRDVCVNLPLRMQKVDVV